ncbi:MAG: hypothetical protein EZS28_021617 [Streblomastix strix]|uniref:Uncharacterized protein n=1 Tax=Streblomastix strix TaxID=222440 RepID=A0A5J4VK69_9EUKA|nr:MAG: hypothetical protein EZS28_021617 [Streblomastix strix]
MKVLIDKIVILNREAQLSDQINEDNRYEQEIQLEKNKAQIEHQLKAQQELLNNQRVIVEKVQGRANQEEIRRKEAELQRGQLQGECKIIQRENLKLKKLLTQYLTEAEQLQFEEDDQIENEKNKEMKQKEELKHREYQSKLHNQRSGLLTTIIQEKDLEKRKIIPWQKIAKDMNKPINEENEEEIQELQEKIEQGCETIKSTLQGKIVYVKRKEIIQRGIVEGLINIFEHRDLKLVTRSQTVAFANLTAPCSTDTLILLYEKQHYPGLMRLFDHQNQLIVDDAVASLFNIVCGGSSSVPETEAHPHYQSMIECDGIKKLHNLFQRSADKYSKDRSASALGKLYRMKEIEDAEMKADIIGHLKSINNDDAFTKREARAALREIMQNPEYNIVKVDDGEDCIVIE